MTTNTRDKLTEAQLFLNEMQVAQEDFNNRDQFRYKLNAFLSAFRGVTDKIMLAEYRNAHDTQGKSKFQTWFETEWKSLKLDNDIDFLVEARNVTIHEEPVRPRVEVECNLPTAVRPRASLSYVIIRTDGSAEDPVYVEPDAVPPEQPTVTNAMTTRYFFNPVRAGLIRRRTMPHPPCDDVTTACRKGLGALESLVSAVEARFKLP